MPIPRLIAIVSIGVAAVFIAYPQIDLMTASWFYRPEQGFIGQHTWLPNFLSDAIVWVAIISFFVPVLLWGLKKLPGKSALFLVLALLLGPALVVNGVFKDHWGRARPYQTIEFGGDKEFTPAFIFSSQCDKNCSFVAGDPSVGFYLIAYAFIFTRQRKEITAVALSTGGILGLGRMSLGKHFLSDVLFSGIFVYLVCFGLYWIMFQKFSAKQNSPAS